MPGAPRGADRRRASTPRDVANDIWASDLHLTPDGKFLYAAERTSSTLGAFSVDAATGKLTYLSSTPTEKQPRGFAIDPKGKFMVVSGREIGDDLGLRDRPGERRADPAAESTRRAKARTGSRSSASTSRKTRGGMNPPVKEIAPERLLAVVAAVAKEARPHVEPHATLDSSLEKELGLDSLARVELVLRLEKEFGASLPEQALATSETPRDLLRFLLSCAGHAPQAADRSAASVASLVQTEGVRAPSETQARTLTEALEYHVERQPDRLTVFMYEEQKEFPLSYRALWDGAMGYAARLARGGPAARADGGDHAADLQGVPLLASTACCSRAACRCRSIRRRG